MQIDLGGHCGEEYIITITNIGDGPAYGVSVKDDYPNNFSVTGVNSVQLNGGAAGGYSTSDNGNVYTLSNLPVIMPGDTLEVRVQMSAGCLAAHGFNGNQGGIDYYEIPEGGAVQALDDKFDTEVLFGILEPVLEATHINGVALGKPTANPDAKVGDVVTYRGVLKNGFDGDLYDVTSSASWGTELSYVAGSLVNAPAMNCSDGAAINCVPVTVPANTDDTTYSFTFDLQVDGCIDIDATIDASERCTPAGDSLSGSVYLDLGNPDISYTISSMDIPYGGSVPVTIDITNSGKGPARSFSLDTSFEGKCVSLSNFAPGWSYNAGTGILSYNGVIDAAGGANDNAALTFDLATCGDCANRSPSGQILFEPSYYNDCDEEFISPKEFASFSTSDVPTVSLSKTASSNTVNIGDQIDYTLTLSVSDKTLINGDIVITDIFQGEQTLSVAPVASEGVAVIISPTEIRWTVGTGAADNPDGAIMTFSATVSDPCDQGATTLNNSSFTASDFLGCPLSGSADSGTIYINNNSGGGIVTTDKTISGGLQVCDSAGVMVTNESVIDIGVTGQWDSGGGTPSTFTDDLAGGNLCYMDGTAQYSLDTDDTAAQSFTSFQNINGADIISTNPLIINLSFLETDDGDADVAGNDLQIQYKVYACEGVSGTQDAVSTLRIDGNAGSCGSGGEYAQHGLVSVSGVNVGLGIDIAQVIENCGDYDVTISVTNDSGDYTDLVINFPTDNYEVYDFAANPPTYTGFDGNTPDVSGVNPIVFSFDDDPANPDPLTEGGTIKFKVRKSCLPEVSSVSATGTYYTPEGASTCCAGGTCGGTLGNLSASDSPLFYYKGDLEIKATPNPYPIDTTSLTWKLYVYNRGDGNAYNVNVNDIFGPNLGFVSATVDGAVTAPNITAGPGTSTTYDWDLGNLLPNQTVEIEITAEMTGYSCVEADTTSSVTVTWGCGADICETLNAGAVPTFSFKESEASAYNVFPKYVNLCEEAEVVFRIKNINKADVYAVEMIQDLETTGLTYVAGSAKFATEPAAQNDPASPLWNPAADPVIAGTRLTWQGSDSAAGNYLAALEKMNSGDNVLIYFKALSDCVFPENPQMHVEATYQKFCDVGSARREVLIQDQQSIPFNAPEVEIIKEARNATDGGVFATTNVYAGQNDEIEYRITITNNSDFATAQNVTLTDVLPDNLFYISITKQDGEVSGNPAGEGPDWILESVGPKDTDRYIIRARIDKCVEEVPNTADVTLGCDSSGCTFVPALGYDSQDIHGNLVTQVSLSTSAAVGASGFNTCGGEISISVSNAGAKSGNVIIAPELPKGWIYDDSGGNSITYTPNTGQSCLVPCPDFIAGDQHLPQWTIDSLNTNEEVTITFYVKADGYYCDNDIDDPDSNCPPPSVSIPISINMQDTCGNDNEIEETLTLNPDCPDVDISITPPEQLVEEGQTATFTVRLDNKGTTRANNLRLEMFLGNGYTITTPASTPPDIVVNNGADPRTIVWEDDEINNGNGIAAGGSWSTTVEATVNAGNLNVDGTISGYCHDFADDDLVPPCRHSWDKAAALATPNAVGIFHEKIITKIDEPGQVLNPSSGEASIGNAVYYEINVRFLSEGTYSNVSIIDDTDDRFLIINSETRFDTGSGWAAIGTISNGIQIDSTDSDRDRNYTIHDGGGTGFTIAPGAGALDITLRVVARVDGTNANIGNNPLNQSQVEFTFDPDGIGDRPTATFSYADAAYTNILQSTVNTRIFEPNLTPNKTYPDWGTTYTDANPREVVVGDTVDYTLTFTNSTANYTSPAYDVVVTDIIPFGMRSELPTIQEVFIDTNGNFIDDGPPVDRTLAGAGVDYTVTMPDSGNAYTLNITLNNGLNGDTANTNIINAGESLVVKYQAEVDSNSGAGLLIQNQAHADYSTIRGTPVIPEADERTYTTADVHTTLSTGDATMTKTSTLNGAMVEEADQIIYTLTFPNPVQGVYLYGDDDDSTPGGSPEFYDTIPDGLEIITAAVSVNPTRACEDVYGTVVPPYTGGAGSCANDDRVFDISTVPVGAGTRNRTVNIQFNKLYPGDYMVITIKARVHHDFDDASLIPNEHVFENQGHIEIYTKPSAEAGRTSNTYDSEIVSSIYKKLISITPNHSGQTTPGNWISYDHTVRNQTSSTEIVCFSTASSLGWDWVVYDEAGNILTDGAVKNSLTVAGNDFAKITIRYFVPSDTPDGTIDGTLVLMHPFNPAPAPGTCNDAEILDDVVDTTVVLLTQLELVKWVRRCDDNDFTICDPVFVENNEAYPCEYLEYKIEFINTSTQTYYTLNLNDGVPNHTDFTPNVYGVNQDILLHKPDGTEIYLNVADNSTELLLDLSPEIPQLHPGDKGWIQYKVRVKGKNCP